MLRIRKRIQLSSRGLFQRKISKEMRMGLYTIVRFAGAKPRINVYFWVYRLLRNGVFTFSGICCQGNPSGFTAPIAGAVVVHLTPSP